ncbi:MAG TPA: glycerol kinase GlpK [Bacteroidales bacterium]|jgi:glycerol kinase|nr:glycerol kinase [Bacteroidota bacterium]HJN05934.1 glycerol kinase GlpK [Bacteroidales bacterium]
MKEKYILSLDQGTTSSRAIIFNHKGDVCAIAQKEIEQIFPIPGWVEHNPIEIWSTQLAVASEAIAKLGIHANEIAGIGIANQRETTIIWSRKTGKPIYNAIVWQDHRTAEVCDELIKNGYDKIVKQKTGLELDAYFSATKISWILDNVQGARLHAEKGELAFGTVDSWLIWNLTDGGAHLTDVSNASRTMLFNIHKLEWDEELLSLFNVPRQILPDVKPNSHVFAHTAGKLLSSRIPICGVAGDQQAAMFGQLCLKKGMAKNTYGTGCFLMLNTGEEAVVSRNRLLTTIAWQLNNKVTYALEGSVFVAGAVIQWLRDQLSIINSSEQVEALAGKVDDNGEVYFVPAFTGLGAPYWNQHAKGLIYGLTRGTTKAHIARAALESIAYQNYDVIKAMEKDIGTKVNYIRADGGASANSMLMQFQSDILGIIVERPKILETTALGAAYFAGLAIGYWENTDQLISQWSIDRAFTPLMHKEKVVHLIKNWHEAIRKA